MTIDEKLFLEFKELAKTQSERINSLVEHCENLEFRCAEMENKLIASANLIEELRFQIDNLKPAGYRD